jgi:hypothetical protein
LSTTNLGTGTQTLFMQQNGPTGQIQVRVTTACTVTWWITFL